MTRDNKKNRAEAVCFVTFLLAISFLINWYSASSHIKSLALFIPLCAGILAFSFQLFIDKDPLISLYSKSYPYRKLKPYAWISAFLVFEFILFWGLYTKQILLLGDELILVVVLFIGTIVYYHLFVRMKISLRFLFLSVFIPLLAAGTAVGMASYFGVLKFVIPAKKIGNIVFFNSLYWILLSVLFQVVCEEPAFRGYLLQKLLYKGEACAILISSLCYSLWRVPFGLFSKAAAGETVIFFFGHFITGVIFALLFIKGRNLLVAILCHGIISGLEKSFFASGVNPGIRQYLEFLTASGRIQLLCIWFLCLLIGLLFLTLIPRKKLSGGPQDEPIKRKAIQGLT